MRTKNSRFVHERSGLLKDDTEAKLAITALAIMLAESCTIRPFSCAGFGLA